MSYSSEYGRIRSILNAGIVISFTALFLTLLSLVYLFLSDDSVVSSFSAKNHSYGNIRSLISSSCFANVSIFSLYAFFCYGHRYIKKRLEDKKSEIDFVSLVSMFSIVAITMMFTVLWPILPFLYFATFGN